jgi:hypothetical protein
MDKTFFKDIGFWVLIKLIKSIIDSDLFREIYEKIEMLDFKTVHSAVKKQEIFDMVSKNRNDLRGYLINFIIESILTYIRYHREFPKE